MPPEHPSPTSSAARRLWRAVFAREQAVPALVQDDCVDEFLLPWGGRPQRTATATAGDAPPPAVALPPYITPQGRDLRIDVLRGYFVLAMIVDHVRGPSPLYLLTGGNRFFTSAAEGFILTSGLMAGLVYRKLIGRDGIGPSLQKVMARVFTLYLLTVGLMLLFLPFSEILYLPWAQGVDLSRPLDFVVSVLTLHRTYYLVDVMLLYTVLFLLTPMALLLLARGKTVVVLGASWLLWLLHQFFPAYAAMIWPIEGNYLFVFAAWQLLFFNGLVLGYQRDRIPLLSCNRERNLHILTGIATVALIAFYFVLDPPTEAMPAAVATASGAYHEVRLWFHEYIFAKADLRPGRLLASAIAFSFIFLTLTRWWDGVRRPVGWLLIPLGQNALYAYTVHVGVVGLVAIALLPLHLVYPGPQWLNALIQVAGVLLIWLLARRQFLNPTPKTRPFWHASPAACAVIALIALPWLPSPSHPGLQAPPVVADAAAARARAYGTPAPRTNAYGTPIPRTGASAAVGAPTPDLLAPATPEPPPARTTSVLPDGELLISPYIGEIEGNVYERWFYSATLDREMPYWIYLPPDYGTAGRRYPVLYMLHGGGGHREEWSVYGLVDVTDNEIRTGSLQPFIIVMPQGDRSYWANHTGDGPQWGDYLAYDVVGHIDASYRTLRARSARAIGGLSMGAWGALHQAFTHPDIFGVVGAHSPSLRPDDDKLTFLGTGEEFATKDPLTLAAVATTLKTLQIWIDVGEDDPWVDSTVALHNILALRGIPHGWQFLAGGHEGAYWHEHALDYVRFYGHAVTRQ